MNNKGKLGHAKYKGAKAQKIFLSHHYIMTGKVVNKY